MTATTSHYYVPNGSYWPIMGSIGLTTTMVGFGSWLNGWGPGGTMAFIGVAIIIAMMFGWFGTVINESLAGTYNSQVDRSFRWGMGWFIFSEVCFFAAFFGALFYARELSVPWLMGEGAKESTHLLLWNDYFEGWPTNGPGNLNGEFELVSAWGIPALNTVILLTSGVTVTFAHWALLKKNRGQLILFLFLTVALGATFVGFQVYEYGHAYSELNLTLKSGIYGSTFYMLTGFHGAHVTIGAIMLTVMLFRAIKGHFSPESHFAFEATAWYWHFVDVAWRGLFVFVYWL